MGKTLSLGEEYVRQEEQLLAASAEIVRKLDHSGGVVVYMKKVFKACSRYCRYIRKKIIEDISRAETECGRVCMLAHRAKLL